MKSPNMNRFFSLFALLVLASVFAPYRASAQWYDDSLHNTMICDATGQQDYPVATSDGNNGAIIAWEDNRSSTFQIYAQHVNATGVTTWKAQGVQLCKVQFAQRYPFITTDNNGGAYVVWEDSRYS